MNLNVSGHHVDMTQALKDYVNTKMKRVERHFEDMISADVILEVEKLRHKAEATLQVSGATLHAEDVEEDMYAAIDGMMDKLDRQVRRFKDKRSDHHNREAQKANLHAI